MTKGNIGLNKGSGVLNSAHSFHTAVCNFLSQFNCSVPKYWSIKCKLVIFYACMQVIFPNINRICVHIYKYICANHKFQHKRWNSVTGCMLLCIVATCCMFLCVAKHTLEQEKFRFDGKEKILHFEELALEKGPRNTQLAVYVFRLGHFFSNCISGSTLL